VNIVVNLAYDSPKSEPVIHSHHTDVLPEGHPLAHKLVNCQHCNSMVHCDNNECMTTWIEWGDCVLCGECFVPLLECGVLEWVDFLKQCGR
jgi:hypothetical protein